VAASYSRDGGKKTAFTRGRRTIDRIC